MIDYCVGVDIGIDGGIVVINKNNKIVIDLPVPKLSDFKTVDKRKYLNYFKYIAKKLKGKKYTVYLEDVHAIFGASAGATFKFGSMNELPEAACIMLNMPYMRVQPKKWQKVAWVNIIPVRKPSKKDKNGKLRKGTINTKVTSELAVQRIWPEHNFKKITKTGKESKNNHDGRIDAALIAYYGMVTAYGGNDV